MQALNIAKNDPNVQMFIWFVFHDTMGNPWQSGLFTSGGSQKPAYDAFGAVARLTDGSTFTVKAGTRRASRCTCPTSGTTRNRAHRSG